MTSGGRGAGDGGSGRRDGRGRGRPRAHAASHADRELVIEALKDAFVHGRLTKDELDARAGRALAARTCTELAALTAEIPPARAAPGLTRPQVPTRPPVPARRRPLGRAAPASIAPGLA